MEKKKPGVNWLKLVSWIVGVELVGILGGVITSDAIPDWYASLEKPWFNPPNWLFGPVWTLLYAMIGYSGYLLWNSQRSEMRNEKLLFAFQLFLNGVWSPVFFGLRNLELALVIILMLVVVLLFLQQRLWQKQRKVFWWLLPYFGWVSFASVLNASLVVLN